MYICIDDLFCDEVITIVIAKVYKLVDGKYDKQDDFFNQKYKFENTTCKAEVDFKYLFKKFRIRE